MPPLIVAVKGLLLPLTGHSHAGGPAAELVAAAGRKMQRRKQLCWEQWVMMGSDREGPAHAAQ